MSLTCDPPAACRPKLAGRRTLSDSHPDQSGGICICFLGTQEKQILRLRCAQDDSRFCCGNRAYDQRQHPHRRCLRPCGQRPLDVAAKGGSLFGGDRLVRQHGVDGAAQRGSRDRHFVAWAAAVELAAIDQLAIFVE